MNGSIDMAVALPGNIKGGTKHADLVSIQFHAQQFVQGQQ